jgi:hypothetical protein
MSLRGRNYEAIANYADLICTIRDCQATLAMTYLITNQRLKTKQPSPPYLSAFILALITESFCAGLNL